MARIRRDAMTKRKPQKKVGRYDILEITRRIEHERARARIEVKDFAERLGMTMWTYYKRAEGTYMFSVEELGLAADALGAPPLWPFADWALLERVFGRTLPRDGEK